MSLGSVVMPDLVCDLREINYFAPSLSVCEQQ